MGVDTRKKPLPLPAPTESSTLQISDDNGPNTDLATDVSRRTDHTSYSIPEDGSPITLPTTKKRDKHGKRLDKSGHHSQTSLLIEYFEGGKQPNVHTRPSVRVKVTPSSARKGKESKDHIQITEGGGTRKPSYTRRISLGPKNAGETHVLDGDEQSVSSLAESSSLSGRHPPVEVEVMHKDPAGSDLSGTSLSNGNRYVPINPSEISSMPPDSMLDGRAEPTTPRHARSRDLVKDEVLGTADTLKTPSRRRSRSLSRERITQRVIEKLGRDPGAISGHKHKHSKSRSRSVSHEQLKESTSSPRKRSSKRHSVEAPSGESSLVTASQVSDGRSFRSGTSRSSYNNPKLLEMVEDTVRRLILPEITALKAEQKTQTNLRKFEHGKRDSAGSIGSREELSRKLSKHASDPNVRGKPKVVLNRDENNPGLTLSGDSVRGKGRHDKYNDSPSEKSFERGMSEETVIRDDGKESRKRSKEGHRLRDTAAAAVVGGLLTHAALKHHDSKSSIERRERRRKRSKSHSRSHSLSTSVADTEEIFYKHDVPPMPMRSEITNSELTRDSLLSERTSTPTSERKRAEIREIARASPKQFYSPVERTPTRSPADLRGLGTLHQNDSRDDLGLHSAHSEGNLHEGKSQRYGQAALTGAAAGVGLAAARHALSQYENRDERAYTPGRGLSPIQSVASFEEQDTHHEEVIPRAHSAGSISSTERHHEKDNRLSAHSVSSLESARVIRSNRPQGINLESGSEILGPHDLRSSNPELSRDPTNESWYDDNERYRDDSYRNSTVDVRHLTNFTDDSTDAPNLDKVTAAQQIRGIGANAEYIHTPIAVESAVASLLDPSVVDVDSNRSGPSRVGESYLDSPESDIQYESFARGNQSTSNVARGSPLKQQHNFVDQDLQTISGNVYNRTTSNSPKRRTPHLAGAQDSSGRASAHMDPTDPLPEFLPGMESPSDISTNPPDIQGPRREPLYDTPMQWPYQKAASPQEQDRLARSSNTSAHESLKAAAANMLSAAAGAGAAAALAQRESQSKGVYNQGAEREIHGNYSDEDQDDHPDIAHDHGGNHAYTNDKLNPVSVMPKDDEGYQTEDPIARSAGVDTPDNRPNRTELFPDDGFNAGMPGLLEALGDPFSEGHVRSASGNSHGMASPLYDSATGTGIDRIQSKDIVALMNHLTVRDSQRNARDTEILVTLVRSAAEMRNSFEEMKRFIADQDEMLISVGNKQHEKTQRVIGGPRPQPAGAPRIPRRSSSEDFMDDVPAKRRNVFRRALKGLGGKNTNDLAKIEDMLNHLLDEVADLKSGQDVRPVTTTPRGNGLTSYEQLRDAPQDGYEPEGQAGTSSNENHSGYFSNPPSRQGSRQQGYDRRRASENRISTVLEEHEDVEEGPLEPHEQDVLGYENTEHMLIPTRDMPRGGSVPLNTPPTVHVPAGPQSNEHTPRMDKSRKHKSSSSSFFPKISRWSKTTASSVADNARNSARKERPFSGVSQSGSDLQNYDVNEHYDPQGDDRVSFANDRPPSPLIPSQVSEKPAYRAHRDSLNLQHPQPRQGHTARYQNHLESQVHDMSSPISPTSDQFGSNPALARFGGGGQANRNSNGGNLSPVSDRAYSEVSAAQKSSAPARPPKIRDDGPLVPPKVPVEEEKKKPTFAERSAPAMEYNQANGSAESSSPPNRLSPQRKPTGPRPITSSGSYSPDKIADLQKTRYRGSPNHIGSSSVDVTF